jgi:hypothetical protein
VFSSLLLWYQRCFGRKRSAIRSKLVWFRTTFSSILSLLFVIQKKSDWEKRNGCCSWQTKPGAFFLHFLIRGTWVYCTFNESCSLDSQFQNKWKKSFQRSLASVLFCPGMFFSKQHWGHFCSCFRSPFFVWCSLTSKSVMSSKNTFNDGLRTQTAITRIFSLSYDIVVESVEMMTSQWRALSPSLQLMWTSSKRCLRTRTTLVHMEGVQEKYFHTSKELKQLLSHRTERESSFLFSSCMSIREGDPGSKSVNCSLLEVTLRESSLTPRDSSRLHSIFLMMSSLLPSLHLPSMWVSESKTRCLRLEHRLCLPTSHHPKI